MQRRILLLLLPLLSLGCAGAQQGERGEIFCESYENSYVGQCRQNCEATSDGDTEEVGKQCEETCYEDLKDDDTFASDCTGRVKEL